MQRSYHSQPHTGQRPAHPPEPLPEPDWTSASGHSRVKAVFFGFFWNAESGDKPESTEPTRIEEAVTSEGLDPPSPGGEIPKLSGTRT